MKIVQLILVMSVLFNSCQNKKDYSLNYDEALDIFMNFQEEPFFCCTNPNLKNLKANIADSIKTDEFYGKSHYFLINHYDFNSVLSKSRRNIIILKNVITNEQITVLEDYNFNIYNATKESRDIEKPDDLIKPNFYERQEKKLNSILRKLNVNRIEQANKIFEFLLGYKVGNLVELRFDYYNKPGFYNQSRVEKDVCLSMVDNTIPIIKSFLEDDKKSIFETMHREVIGIIFIQNGVNLQVELIPMLYHCNNVFDYMPYNFHLNTLEKKYK